jgi:protein ImuB
MRLLYLHVERFPIQRQVIETPALAGKPIAFVQEVKGQRKIVFVSSAGLTAGLRPGMTLAAATALVGTLRHFPYRPEAERAALMSLAEPLLLIAPAFQLCPPDGLWLDASAAALCHGEEGLCRRALEICASRGYRACAAIASEVFTARALTRHGRKAVQVILPQNAGRALEALPLSALEHIDGSAVAALRSLGLTALGEVASLPPGALLARMGTAGLLVHRLCRGEDDTAFVPTSLPEVLEESIDLDWPAESLEPLLFALKTTLDRLCARLWGRKRAAIHLVLTLKLDPAGEARVSLVLARPSARPKLLLELAKHRIADLTLPNPVASLKVTVERSCDDPGTQLGLGDEPEGDAALEVVLSRLSSVLGEDALFAAQLEPVHRPEAAYAAKSFHPPAIAKGLLADAEHKIRTTPQGEELLVQRPSRVLERPASLAVNLDGEGDLRSARLLGKHRKVLALCGPERLSGEWWGDASYNRDYYRVYFDGFGPAWIFRDARDGRFYLHGMFD